MHAQKQQRYLWLAVLLGILCTGYQFLVFAGLPGLSLPQRVLLALPGIACLPLMAHAVARYRHGSAWAPAALVRDFLAPRPRGERGYLALAILFGGACVAWWFIGLMGLAEGGFTPAQRVTWGLVGVPSLLLGVHFFTRYWYR